MPAELFFMRNMRQSAITRLDLRDISTEPRKGWYQGDLGGGVLQFIQQTGRGAEIAELIIGSLSGEDDTNEIDLPGEGHIFVELSGADSPSVKVLIARLTMQNNRKAQNGKNQL